MHYNKIVFKSNDLTSVNFHLAVERMSIDVMRCDVVYGAALCEGWLVCDEVDGCSAVAFRA